MGLTLCAEKHIHATTYINSCIYYGTHMLCDA